MFVAFKGVEIWYELFFDYGVDQKRERLDEI